MKVRKSEILRIENIINGDRLCPDDNFKNLLQVDLKKLLSDYFNLSVPPELRVVKGEGNYRVEIFFIAENIKKFKYIKE